MAANMRTSSKGGARAIVSSGVLLFALFGACSAADSLRGTSTLAQKASTEPPTPSEVHAMIGCSCAAEDACQCSHTEPSHAQTETGQMEQQALLERTKQVVAWWQAQDEATRAMPWWSTVQNETTTELWVAAHGSRTAVAHTGGATAVHHSGATVVHGGTAVVHGGTAVVHGGAAACGHSASCGCIGHAGCGCAARAGCVAR